MSELYAIRVSDDYLEHHGVDGQKWGKRNGPPYPLNAEGKADLREQKKAEKEQKKIEKYGNLKNRAKQEYRAGRRYVQSEKAKRGAIGAAGISAVTAAVLASTTPALALPVAGIGASVVAVNSVYAALLKKILLVLKKRQKHLETTLSTTIRLRNTRIYMMAMKI